jgi:hypothetical protein
LIIREEQHKEVEEMKRCCVLQRTIKNEILMVHRMIKGKDRDSSIEGEGVD